MARGGDRDRDRDRTKRGPKDMGRRGGKKRVCIFCKDHIAWVDYKDANLLRRFMSDRGKIRARRVSGNCAQHQREVAVAIKTARELALLPYTQRTVSERGPGSRGPRGGPGGPGRGPAPRRDDRDDDGPDLDLAAIVGDLEVPADLPDVVASDDVDVDVDVDVGVEADDAEGPA
jgi:small subunit ribosomal protein S18